MDRKSDLRDLNPPTQRTLAPSEVPKLQVLRAPMLERCEAPELVEGAEQEFVIERSHHLREREGIL